METATRLIVEWEDQKTHCLAGRLTRPLDLHEVNDFLIKRLGKRPSMIVIIDGVAIANYLSV